MQFQLTQPLHSNRQLRPDALAACGSDGAQARTWTQLADRVARIAGVLRGPLGLEPGDRVGMLALNAPVWLDYYYATWWAGAVVNPLNTRWTEAEIGAALGHSETRVLLVDAAFLALAQRLPSRVPGALTLVCCGEGPAPAGLVDLDALLRDQAPLPDARRCGDDLAGLFYTSGTTGDPKGVMLSHHNLYANALQALLGANLLPDDRILQVVPLFHLAGLSLLLRAVLRGSTQVMQPAFEPLAVLRALSGLHITLVLLVPTMMQMLVDHPARDGYDLRSVRMVGYGAAPISEALLERAMPAFPRASFEQGYGQSELSPCLTILSGYWHTAAGRARSNKLRSAGVPLPGCDVRIVDPEDRELPRGEVGEIIARSPGVMQGYWRAPELTAQALRGGWLHTGDLGFMDADGCITLVDRLKDMIVSGGENVYSAEVENALLKHPAIASCAVIGIPDPRWGEAVHAVVVARDPAAAPDPDVLLAHCRALIAGYKCPRSIEFRTALPLSGVGKILKHVLRAPYWRDQGRSVA